MFVDPCESRLTVHLSCNNLKNMDILGRSDPFALLFLDNTGATTRPLPHQTAVHPTSPASATTVSSRGPTEPISAQDDIASNHISTVFRATSRPGAYTPRDTRWQKIGVTETIANSLNATFATSFEVPYFFERAQRLAVDIFDRDAAPSSRDDQELHRHDYLGSADVALPAIVRSKGQRLTVPLRIPDRPGVKCGTVTIAVEEVSEQKQRIAYDAHLTNVPVRRGYGPVVTISRQPAAVLSPPQTSSPPPQRQPNRVENRHHQKATNDGWITVYRSTRAAPDTKGGWRNRHILPEFSSNYEKLCRCSDTTPLRFDISYERRGKHRTLLTAQTSLQQIAAKEGRLPLTLVETSCFPSPREGAFLTLANRQITEDTTFLDYIIGGCEISLVIALDYTASNGDPSKRGTLHFCDSMEANEYETAIRSVGDILASYDSDQLFPVFGFGAKLPPEYTKPSHVFSITEDAIVDGALQDPSHFCFTIDGVLNAYRHALYNVRLAGPTVFAEVIQAGADHARCESRDNNQAYTILLIVTDGVINDVEQTLDALFQASSLPFSIVIIGVGDADFTDMDLLDGDDLGRERDIVQFVNYRQYKDTPEVLRSRVLEEIPRQFLQYMSQRNINPLPPPDDD